MTLIPLVSSSTGASSTVSVSAGLVSSSGAGLEQPVRARRPAMENANNHFFIVSFLFTSSFLRIFFRYLYTNISMGI